MAKIYLDHFKKKYGWSGGKYTDLIQKILTNNVENISRRIGAQTIATFTKKATRIGYDRRRFIIPDLGEILPKRSVFILKGAEQGRVISDSLRDALTSNLKQTMTQFTPKTGEAKYIYRRGALAGRANPKLIQDFEARIKETFQGYIKKDPALKGGMPKNVHTIAVTEMRSAISNMKDQYMQKAVEKNPDVDWYKKWIHNSSQSRGQYRPGHKALNGRVVKYGTPFTVPRMKLVRGRWIHVGDDYMDHPHAPGAPADQVINCHCDFDILARKKPK